jgi:GrpB-like predicted nucleotidyltransferase (UPF0157 family)
LRTVTIVEHRAAWSVEFEAVAMELREALGVDALQLDHIGSTAYSTPSRTPFRSDGGQHSTVMADTVPR